MSAKELILKKSVVTADIVNSNNAMLGTPAITLLDSQVFGKIIFKKKRGQIILKGKSKITTAENADIVYK